MKEPTAAILNDPGPAASRPPGAHRLLEVKGLVKHFAVRKSLLLRSRGRVHAVDGLSFTLEENETLGLVGESGCGKSTAGFSILRIIEPTAGEVWFEGRDLLALDREQMRQVRRRMQVVFQDPYGSLNPRLTVARIVEEPLSNYEAVPPAQRSERVIETLRLVGLRPEQAQRFPHEFSGGQRQRICIARALILGPKLIVCDEPVSALDVSVRAQVLNLMVRLQNQLSLSYLFISHDLSVVRYISHRVAVMYLGQIVELSPVRDLYAEPLHPYTRALLSAVPAPDPRRRRQRIILEGDVPSPLNPPSGCRFHPRCPERKPVCLESEPEARRVNDKRLVKCHLYDGHPAWRPDHLPEENNPKGGEK
ncbi:MAG: dipeptide ABC transporter ATP-binding protein [Thermodesulfobacteriota bacterium]